MSDLHESNMQTLNVAHQLTYASRIVTEAIDRKLEDNPGADEILVSADRLRDLRLVITAQEEAIRKLVERDLEIADMIMSAHKALK